MEQRYLIHYYDGDGYTYAWFDTQEELEGFIENGNEICLISEAMFIPYVEYLTDNYKKGDGENE